MTLNSALLDQVEELYLRAPGWSAPRVLEHLKEQRVHGPGCPMNGCHCPPKYPAPGGGHYSLRAVQLAMQKVRERLRARSTADREASRDLAVARYDYAFQVAAEAGNARDMVAAVSRRADLDGSHVAAEEAGHPSLYDRVLGMMAQVTDYNFASPQDAPAPFLPEQARFALMRLEQLLMRADDTVARFRQLGDPDGKDEAERRSWRTQLLDEATRQAAQAPGLLPGERRDQLARLVSASAYTTEDTEIAEGMGKVLKRLRGM